jgi:hypothetical protein
MRSKIYLFSLTILFLGSCTPVVQGVYGIRDARPVGEVDVLAAAKSFGIPLAQCVELRKEYIDYLFSLDRATHSLAIHDHYQPLQLLYYSADGKLVSFHPNCYLGGFPNLRWNKGRRLQSFPPSSPAPIDTILPLHRQLEFLKPYSQSASVHPADEEYVLLVYWNLHMRRQSKRMIRAVQENLKKAGNARIRVLYVNNDNAQVYLDRSPYAL